MSEISFEEVLEYFLSDKIEEMDKAISDPEATEPVKEIAEYYKYKYSKMLKELLKVKK